MGYEDYLEPVPSPLVRTGQKLGEVLGTGPTPRLTGTLRYEDLLEPAPTSEGQQQLDVAKYTPTPQQQRDALLTGGGVMMGGVAGAESGAALLPQAPWLGRLVGSGFGQGGMQYTGARASGVQPREATNQALTVGGTGMGVQGAADMVGGLAGLTTSIPGRTLKNTMNMGTQERAGTMIGSPGDFATRDIGVSLRKSIKQAYNDYSPGRLSKVQHIADAESLGVTIPRSALDSAIDTGIAEAGVAEGRANSIAAARLNSLKKGLAKKFPGGIMTPSQADAQLQAFQRDAEMASARNNPFLAKTYYDLKDSLRKSFFDAVDQAVPGSDMAKATKEASDYLRSIEQLDQFVSTKTPENFADALFTKGKPQPSELVALRDFEKQNGTGGMIERDIHRLSMKKDWSSEESGRAYYLTRLVEKILGKPISKIALVSAQPLGNVAAGYQSVNQGSAKRAFTQAMNPQANP